jgi:hypothetical protein
LHSEDTTARVGCTLEDDVKKKTPQRTEFQIAVDERIRRNQRFVVHLRRAIDALELDSALRKEEMFFGLPVPRDFREPEGQHLARFRRAIDKIDHEKPIVAQYTRAIDRVERATRLHPVIPSDLVVLAL